MKRIATNLLIMPALVAGMFACSSSNEPHSRPGGPAQTAFNTDSVPVKLEMLEAWDKTFPMDTTWYRIDESRAVISVYVDKRGYDWRARIMTPEGQLVKTIYESGLKSGVTDFSFNPQAMLPGDYVWLLTRDVYRDTVQWGQLRVTAR